MNAQIVRTSQYSRLSAGICLGVLVAAFALAVPQAAHAATFAPVVTGKTSQEYYNDCVAQGGYKWVCLGESYIFDPVSADVASLSLTLKYDPLFESFDPTLSRPLGLFSVGGDAPPPVPGMGTEPLRLMPGSGYTPGALLPG